MNEDDGYRARTQEGIIRAYYDPDGTHAPPIELHHCSSREPPVAGRSILTDTDIMRRTLLVLLVAVALGASGGCVYQASLSQGNLLKQEDLDQVELGMTRSQVRFLLGTPMVDDPFHHDRWDYIYFIRVGRKAATYKRWVSIFFENDAVSKIVSEQELSPDL